MKLKWRKSGKYAYKRARRYEHIGRERKLMVWKLPLRFILSEEVFYVWKENEETTRFSPRWIDISGIC